MTVDLSISIVCTNNRDMLRECLCSVYENTRRITFEVFVVDNGSTDGTSEMVRSEFSHVKLIRNETRLGFSTNHNQALRQATGKYLMILNDDTIVLPEAFNNMTEFMDGHPKAGAVGPKLMNPDGSNQPNFAPFPTVISELLVMPLMLRFREHRWDINDIRETDWVSGACLMVRRRVSDQAGLLDPHFDPLYVEETDWCYRIKRAGYKVYYYPAARVVHLGGQTTRHMSVSMLVALYRNKLRFFEKHQGRFSALLFRSLLFILAVGKLVCWLFVVGWPRPRNRLAVQQLSANCQIAKLCLWGEM